MSGVKGLNTAARRAEFARLYDAGRLPGFVRRNETHYQYVLLGDVLDFWPGRGEFLWRGEMYTDIRVTPFIKQKEQER